MSSLSVVFGAGRKWCHPCYLETIRNHGLFHFWSIFVVYARLQLHPNRNEVQELEVFLLGKLYVL